jgi:hypothetical protein
MALITLSIPDDVYAKYCTDANNPAKEIIKQLVRFQDVRPNQRAVVLTDEDRKRLETLYGKPIDATEMRYFIDWIKQRATVKVGDCEVTLNAAQLKRARSNANFWGRTEEDWIKQQVLEGVVAKLGV